MKYLTTYLNEIQKIVDGEGNSSANIMVVGEAPGEKEEIEGRPFVGSAGKILNKLLSSINLKREDIYITNLINFRPPNNRNPLANEIESCKPWLYNQIKKVKPKIIILMGKYSVKQFLPEVKISEDHGKIIRKSIPDIGIFLFFPTYHPASTLYNKSLYRVLENDFARLLKII